MAKTIDDYKKDYNEAKTRGDAAGMKAANDGANRIRESKGEAKQVADKDIKSVEEKTQKEKRENERYDKDPDIAKLQKEAWNIYEQTGRWDTDIQKQLHQQAEAIRNKNGFTGGSDGAHTSVFDKNLYDGYQKEMGNQDQYIEGIPRSHGGTGNTYSIKDSIGNTHNFTPSGYQRYVEKGWIKDGVFDMDAYNRDNPVTRGRDDREASNSNLNYASSSNGLNNTNSQQPTQNYVTENPAYNPNEKLNIPNFQEYPTPYTNVYNNFLDQFKSETLGNLLGNMNGNGRRYQNNYQPQADVQAQDFSVVDFTPGGIQNKYLEEALKRVGVIK